MILIFVILVWLIGLSPDESKPNNLHPPPTGDGPNQSRDNFWREGAFGGNMPRPCPPMIGKLFGKLKVLEFAGCWRGPNAKSTRGYFRCQCECGTIAIFDGSNLRTGLTKSCGCARNVTHGETSKGTISHEYKCWSNMKARCLYKSTKYWDRYGGRGIKVCERWLNSFENFLADMGRCPQGMTIGRIDNDGHYTPSNCRWETRTQQQRNRSNSRRFTFKGQSKTVPEFAESVGISERTIRSRLQYGWSIYKALTTPVVSGQKT